MPHPASVPMPPERSIIVTRPAAQAGDWIEALEARGWRVVPFPLIDIFPLATPDVLDAAWRTLPGKAWVMFVSANAVVGLWGAGRRNWPLDVRVGATGGGTAAALQAHGVSPALIDRPGMDEPQDTESLWRHIAARPWRGRQTLIVRGRSQDASRPARDWLIDRLREQGAQVEVITVYERRAPAISVQSQAWLQGHESRQGLWLFSSSEAIANLPAADWGHAIAVTTHARIAAAADKAGFGRVLVTGPQKTAVIGSIESTL